MLAGGVGICNLTFISYFLLHVTHRGVHFGILMDLKRRSLGQFAQMEAREDREDVQIRAQVIRASTPSSRGRANAFVATYAR